MLRPRSSQSTTSDFWLTEHAANVVVVLRKDAHRKRTQPYSYQGPAPGTQAYKHFASALFVRYRLGKVQGDTAVLVRVTLCKQRL